MVCLKQPHRFELWLGQNNIGRLLVARVNQILGNIEDPLRGFNYLVILDDIGPGEIRDAGYEALTFISGRVSCGL